MLVLLQGFTFGAGLIIAIGAQNVFVLRQGLMRKHLLLTATLCATIDALLIILGTSGFGEVLKAFPFLFSILNYGAALFLFFYGGRALFSIFKPKIINCGEEEISSIGKTILMLLALSLLNPHVYLDTVILLGTIAHQQPVGTQHIFAIGAMSASFLWFFSLTFGARFLAPLLKKPLGWKVLDGFTAAIMWVTGISLIW